MKKKEELTNQEWLEKYEYVDFNKFAKLGSAVLTITGNLLSLFSIMAFKGYLYCKKTALAFGLNLEFLLILGVAATIIGALLVIYTRHGDPTYIRMHNAYVDSIKTGTAGPSTLRDL